MTIRESKLLHGHDIIKRDRDNSNIMEGLQGFFDTLDNDDTTRKDLVKPESKVFIFRYLYGLGNKDICEVMDINKSMVTQINKDITKKFIKYYREIQGI